MPSDSAPTISCICCTYGRWWHLEEAIESFLRQDYDGPAELLIVNDMADQELDLSADAPLPAGDEWRSGQWTPGLSHQRRIRIINFEKRFMPNNLKFDFGVEQAEGEYCCFWDDDDVSLPWRLSLSARHLHKHNYYRMPWRWHYDQGQQPELIHRGVHGGDTFRRDAYLAVGGSNGKGHNDQVSYARLREYGGYLEAGTPEECFYVYRWAGITAHHSAYGESVLDCMAQFDRTVREDPRFRTGRIELTPRYHEDYETMCADALKSWKEIQSSRKPPLFGKAAAWSSLKRVASRLFANGPDGET